MFEEMSFREKALIYQGLLSLVKNNSGFGFANNDQGHPAYAVGCNGTIDIEKWGDSPDKNLLFKMMHELSVDLSAAEIDQSSEIGEYIFSWSDFCSLAYDAYQRTKEK
jgi:hypothetical protein